MGEAMLDLYAAIKAAAGKFEVTCLGIAGLERAHVRQAVLAQGGDMLKPYTRCVSIGIAMFDPIVDMLPSVREDNAVGVAYRHHCYNVLNQRLDLTASCVASVLQAAGHLALPLPASLRVSDAAIAATFSHKLGALRREEMRNIPRHKRTGSPGAVLWVVRICVPAWQEVVIFPWKW